MQIPIITICLIAFLLVLKYRIGKSDNDQKEVEARFWERERQANATRRKDINNLNYITIPDDLFPLIIDTDSEKKLLELKNKKILNLTGYTNTDIKLEFGMPNLDVVAEYDDNFTEMVRLIPIYAGELIEAGHVEAAQNILEFAVNNKADSKNVFTMLGQIYINNGNPEKIQKLISIAENLDSLSKNPIITSLNELQTT